MFGEGMLEVKVFMIYGGRVQKGSEDCVFSTTELGMRLGVQGLDLRAPKERCG